MLVYYGKAHYPQKSLIVGFKLFLRWSIKGKKNNPTLQPFYFLNFIVN